MSVLNENLKEEISRNPGVFEIQILACLLGSHSFFLGHHRSVCERTRSGNRRQDFSKNWMNILFEGISAYWGAYDEVQEVVIPRTVVDIHLNEASGQGKLLDKELAEIDVSMANIYDLAENAIESTVRFAESGVFSHWLGVRLSTFLVNDLQSRPGSYTPEEIMERAQSIRDMQADHEEDETIVTVPMAIEASATRGELISSPFPDLDAKIGGGFARGEHTLLASVTGGGKTVMATQLASTFARAGHKVILVTTEEAPARLIYRMYADACSIPYNYFTHTDTTSRPTGLPDMVATDSEWVNCVAEFNHSISDNLNFLDWSASRKSVENDLAAAVTALSTKLNFQPEILIFDWIGAALARGKPKYEVRHLYEGVATELKHMAVTMNLSVFSFAQLNKVQAKNKKRCDHTMIHECKALPDQCVNALYISGLTNNDDEDRGETFLQTQFLNVAKSRFGAGGLVPLMRQFQHQRFRQTDQPL